MADPKVKSPVKLNPSKSYSVFLCKLLCIVLVLVILPLFPSQAPEFINQTMLTKFWELLHLLLIGIAVSYGLFVRKNADSDSGIQSQFDNSETYLSAISHISSIFDNGYENPVGCDDKRMTQTRNPHYSENRYAYSYGFDDKIMLQTRKSQFLESDWEKPRSLNFQKDLEFPLFGDKKVSQMGYCQYFQGESMEFASQENPVLDEWGEKPKWEIDYKPLGLPVRSLRSSIVDHDISEFIEGNGSNSDSKGSCENSCKFGNEKFRGLTPTNLDQEFTETVSLPSPIRWGSRSNGTEVREDKSSSNFQSVGESESEHLKSQSFWSPIFSQTSPIPSEKNEDMESNGEASSVPTKARGFSFGSLSEMNLQRNRDEKLKGFSKSMREDPLSRGNWSVESWKTEGKPKSPVKPFLRGKSVRTIRSSENVSESSKMGDIYSDHVEDKVGQKTNNCDKFETRQNLDDYPLKQSSKLSKSQDGEKQEFVETNEVESDKDSESEFERFQLILEEEEETEEDEAQFESANGAELDPNEVDKKAGEFIAKFREQIRLQKVESIKGFNDL